MRPITGTAKSGERKVLSIPVHGNRNLKPGLAPGPHPRSLVQPELAQDLFVRDAFAAGERGAGSVQRLGRYPPAPARSDARYFKTTTS